MSDINMWDVEDASKTASVDHGAYRATNEIGHERTCMDRSCLLLLNQCGRVLHMAMMLVLIVWILG